MRTKLHYFLSLSFTYCLLNVTASTKATNELPPTIAKSKTNMVVKPFVSCLGIPPFAYGAYYYPGARVVYAGNLYIATQQNQFQFPASGQYWARLGPCN
jgi:hypothetical protein